MDKIKTKSVHGEDIEIELIKREAGDITEFKPQPVFRDADPVVKKPREKKPLPAAVAGSLPMAQRQCEECDNVFIPTRAWAMFCSPPCRWASAKRKYRGTVHQSLNPHDPRPEEPGQVSCPVCGMSFYKRTHVKAYCSVRCRNRAQGFRFKKVRDAKKGMQTGDFK